LLIMISSVQCSCVAANSIQPSISKHHVTVSHQTNISKQSLGLNVTSTRRTCPVCAAFKVMHRVIPLTRFHSPNTVCTCLKCRAPIVATWVSRCWLAIFQCPLILPLPRGEYPSACQSFLVLSLPLYSCAI